MPAIRIDASELAEVLRITPPEQNVMLIGNHGIGKSQIVTSFFSSLRRRVVTFFLGQMSDPGDLIGLMTKNAESGHSEFMPPYWWPLDDLPIVLFLDELNRARPEILQSVMDLTLNRTLAGRALPAGSQVVAAVNEGEEYQLTDLDPALVSRFNVYQFSPTIEDWLLWAATNGIDDRVIQFIQANSEYLDGDPKSAGADSGQFGADLVRTPDRRAWQRVSDSLAGIKEVSQLQVKIIAGIVGINAAMQFAKSVSNSELITADEVLLRFAKAKPRLMQLRAHEFASLNERLLLRIVQGGYKSPPEKNGLEELPRLP